MLELEVVPEHGLCGDQIEFLLGESKIHFLSYQLSIFSSVWTQNLAKISALESDIPTIFGKAFRFEVHFYKFYEMTVDVGLMSNKGIIL